MELKHHKLRQLESGRRRGWIVYLLFTARPTPLSFKMLWELLDANNMPLTCRQFSEKLEYLRSLGYLRVFENDLGDALTNTQQARLIQKFCDHDGDGGDHYYSVLSTDGVKFQEGHLNDESVSRVN